jgi:hypothetical protein
MATINNGKDARACLLQLVGTWHGSGRGGFPTMDPFDYREVLRVSRSTSNGLFQYVQRTWRLTPTGETPSHQETGFINVVDDGRVEVMNAQGTDRVEVMHGRIERNGAGWQLGLESILHGHDERVRTATRTIRLSGGNLSYTMRMTTDRVVEAESHLEAQLELRAS